jgi:hydrogenase assembly chaperone HypC/HupF
MCLTIPAKVISVNKNKAKIKVGKKEKVVDCQLVDVKKGDWVVLTNNFITAKLSPKEARDILKFIKKEVG